MKLSIINFQFSKVKKWVVSNKKEAFILGVVLLVGAYLRLYKISGYMTFLGDEGRDALIVRRFLTDFDIMLVGPGTSIGNMYLGPLYYYLMAPALLIANFSPVGPAVMIALLGVFTILFVWFVAREWFPIADKNHIHWGALIAAFLYSIAPTIIIYSRSSWNPNIMPFFSLLTIYSLWRVWLKREFKWLIIAGVAFAFVMQSHYLGLLLLPVVGVLWGIILVQIIRYRKSDVRTQKLQAKDPKSEIRNQTSEVRELLVKSIQGLIIFATLMSPLVIFDARHGWRNFQALKVFFTERQTTVSARPWTALPKLGDLSLQVNTSILGAHDSSAGYVANILIVAILLWVMYKIIRSRQFRKNSLSHAILILWFVTSLVGFGVYKQHIYDHYFGFLYPVPVLLIAGAFQSVLESKHKIVKIMFSAVLVYLLIINIKQSPLQFPPNRQYERSVTVANHIIQESGGEPFNFAVIAERNYEGAYQYNFERVGANFVVIDPQRADDTITNQLFVICELPEVKCDPTHNDKAEVANFGWSVIEDQWEVFGTTVYKLVHSEK